MSKLSKPERAFQLHKQLKTVVENAKRNFFVMGAILNEIKDEEHWVTMGHETFRSYIADPEIGIKQSSAYHAMKLVNTFTLEETEGIEYSKLITLVPHITKANRDELLEKARTLSRSDLQLELQPGEDERIDEWTMTDVITLIDKKKKKLFRSEIYTKGWVEGLDGLKKDILERNK
jgi:hypothetical protein